MNRETIMSALFTRIAGSSSFVTANRRLKLWSNIASSEKPAIFMAERGDMYNRASEAVPETITMQVEIYIYTDAGKDGGLVPSSVINPLIDAVDTALAPDKLTGRQTLGGLVSHCWIEGTIMKDAGDLDGDGVAVIPVRILVPRS